MTCCFSSNNVSFTCCETSWLKPKKGGRSASCDTCDSKKSKILWNARAYIREGKTPTQFLSLFCQSRKKVLRLHPARPLKRANLVFMMSFCKLCFSELRLFAAKTSLFRHFFPLWCNISPYTYREMFRNLVMRGYTKTTTNCVNTNCRLNRMKWALLFQ